MDAVLLFSYMNPPNISLEEITRRGEKLYVEVWKNILEKEHTGEYAVIDVDQQKYQVDADRLAAIEKAKKEFGDKLFYIVQIGNTQHPSMNYVAKKYAWNL